jgi:multicomponent Na+:H+ antiporter subunit G
MAYGVDLGLFPDWVAMVRVNLGLVLSVAGALLCVIGAIGVLRFPDFYTRLHAASVTDTGGAGLLLIGMILVAGWSIVSIKLVFIFIFLFLTSPTATNAVANAAFVAGLEPLIGVITGKKGGRDGADKTRAGGAS